MSEVASAKMCSVCGVDCSATKRAKDAQGRYICGDCLERARAAKVAKEGKAVVELPPGRKPVEVLPLVTKDGVDAVLDGLLSKSTAMDTKPCTECGYPMQSKALICTHCGFNTQTGKGTRVAVHKAPKEKAVAQGRKRVSLNFGPWGAFFLITVLTLGCLALGMLTQVPAFFIAAYAIWALSSLIVSIALIFDGFNNSPISGTIMVLGLFIPFLGFYTLWYALTQADEVLQKAYIAIWFCGFVGIVAILMSLIPGPNALAG